MSRCGTLHLAFCKKLIAIWLLQDSEARAVQCESDITFQRGQVQQSYIGTVCAQLQRHIASYLGAAVPEGGCIPEGVHSAAGDLVTSLVEVQADLLSLAPPTCITQVCITCPATLAHAFRMLTGDVRLDCCCC